MSGEKDGCSISLEDYDYELPPELIAQHPPPRRADSRLLVLDRAREGLEHRSFRELPGYLREGDILVLNETLVLPGRLRARKESGGKVEVLLLEPVTDRRWQVLLKPGKAFAEGRSLALEKDPEIGITCHERRGQTFIVSFSAAGSSLDEEEVRLLAQRVGEIPLPPYISREQPSRESPEDAERYQTIYARVPGSAAAPTAGLHFTEEVLTALQAKGVVFETVTLHVGVGTFRPLTEADMERFMEWLHADEVLVYASDYPHWDWDEPTAILAGFDPHLRRRVLVENASELYGF